jgi:glucose-6-phosphate isomerase
MLTLDYANCLSPRVGSHGLDPARLAPGGEISDAIAANAAKLAKTRGTGWERWRNLPFDPMRSEHVAGVKKIWASKAGKFDTMIVLGIGGSALGNIALQSALNSPVYNMLPADARRGPRMFVVDNADPVAFGSVILIIDNKPARKGDQQRTAAVIDKARNMLAYSPKITLRQGLEAQVKWYNEKFID